ncbi:MAG: TIM44-like domain-containing protein, partial [Rhizobiales bacterium]|nr:TIM44-like domain-containing protein [Hyphomicrobiales bacterium]
MLRIRRLPLLALLAVVAALSFSVVSADARSSGSFGSRGSRTFSAPPATNTAPRAARPMERSMTQPGQVQTRAATAGQTSAARPGLFGGGLLGGLAAGFIGAGLFGLLFGHGFLGGMAGFASIIGLLLQVALIVIVARLAWAWWQRRNGMATAGGPSLRQGLDGGSRPGLGAGLGSGFAGLGGGASAPAPASEDIEIAGEDFDAFERLLSEIQAAYGKEDLSALRARLTPEMLSYFSEDLAQNASRGVVNEVADVKLLQGDLAEAWREGNDEYATVAMRYALTDRMVDRTSGKVVEEGPSEATELWTFRRVRGG